MDITEGNKLFKEIRSAYRKGQEPPPISQDVIDWYRANWNYFFYRYGMHANHTKQTRDYITGSMTRIYYNAGIVFRLVDNRSGIPDPSLYIHKYPIPHCMQEEFFGQLKVLSACYGNDRVRDYADFFDQELAFAFKDKWHDILEEFYTTKFKELDAKVENGEINKYELECHNHKYFLLVTGKDEFIASVKSMEFYFCKY